jgi:hypothetical protein
MFKFSGFQSLYQQGAQGMSTTLRTTLMTTPRLRTFYNISRQKWLFFVLLSFMCIKTELTLSSCVGMNGWRGMDRVVDKNPHGRKTAKEFLCCCALQAPLQEIGTNGCTVRSHHDIYCHTIWIQSFPTYWFEGAARYGAFV